MDSKVGKRVARPQQKLPKCAPKIYVCRFLIDQLLVVVARCVDVASQTIERKKKLHIPQNFGFLAAHW
jgi:hypothetical protein